MGEPMPVLAHSDVRHFLERVLGTHGADWRVEAWGETYEGWSGALFFDCADDECCLSDPINLSASDLALVATLYESDESRSTGSSTEADE
jgi:hypothetical protein